MQIPELTPLDLRKPYEDKAIYLDLCHACRKAISATNLDTLKKYLSRLITFCETMNDKRIKIPKDIAAYSTIKNVKTGQISSMFA